MKFNRLLAFTNDSSALSKYRTALALLYKLGIDNILRDMGRPISVDINNPRVMELNALENAKAEGWQQCIDHLFGLDEMLVPESDKGLRDYGAIDKMIAEGRIKKEDAESILEGIL